MTDCGCSNFPASLGNVTFGAGVGIGTQPGAPMEIFSSAPSADTTGGGIILSRYNVGGSYRGGAIYSRFISETNTDDLVFAVSGATNPYTDFTQARMVLTQQGHLGLGTTTPATPLHVLSANAGELVRVQGARPTIAMPGTTSRCTRPIPASGGKCPTRMRRGAERRMGWRSTRSPLACHREHGCTCSQAAT